MNEPEGMLLYSPSEMRATPPLWKFVFTNNDEDSRKSLSVLATGFRLFPSEQPCRTLRDAFAVDIEVTPKRQNQGYVRIGHDRLGTN